MLRHSPSRLSRPARVYLLLPVAFRYLAVVAIALVLPHSLELTRLVPIVNQLPRPVWLTLFALLGLAALVAITPRAARLVIALSATVTFVIGLGLEILVIYLTLNRQRFPDALDNATPLVGVLVIALSAADYTVLAFHLTPFSPPYPPPPPHPPPA
jgi:hypothetical protein